MSLGKSVYGYWKDLPPWAKGITVVGSMAVTYFAIRGAYGILDKKLKLAKTKQVVTDAKRDLNALSSRGVRPSYPESQYSLWADRIKAKFDGCDVSTGETFGILTGSGKTLYDISAQFKNDADFLKLVEAWGAERTYDQCGLWNGDVVGTLPFAVADELNEAEIGKINDMLLQNRLTQKW